MTQHVIKVRDVVRKGGMVLAFIMLALGISFAFYQQSKDADKKQAAASVANCRNGNLRSAYELANTSDGQQRERLVRDLLPLNDCEASQAAHRPVLMPYYLQQRFVSIVVHQRKLPIVEGGEIVRLDPLPSERQRGHPAIVAD